MISLVKAMVIPASMYGFLHTIHWGMTQYYSSYCNPSGVGGFLSSFFLSPTPNCTILLSFMEYTSTTYTKQIINALVSISAIFWKK